MTRPIASIYASTAKGPPGRAPSVHPKATTAYRALRSTYRDHRARFDREELLRTEQVYSIIDASEGTERLKRLDECRSSAWFAVQAVSRQVHILSNACHLRWCPLCSKGRSLHLAETVGAWIKYAKSPKFLTLTIRHSNAPLWQQMNYLYQSFRQLKQRKLFVDAVRGGVWFFQIKYSESSQQWHPHLHCLIDAEYMLQATLSDVWCKITKGSRIVDIRQVRSPKEVSEYVARYAARPTQLRLLTLDQGVEVVSSMHGRRICGTWGDARRVSLRPKSKFEPGEYQEIGSWAQMQNYAPLSAYARAIFTAWQTHSPLPLCWDVHKLGSSAHTMEFEKIRAADKFNKRQLFDP